MYLCEANKDYQKKKKKKIARCFVCSIFGSNMFRNSESNFLYLVLLV